MSFQRIASATVIAAALLVGTTGCSFFSPVATQREYQPADGININLGDIKVRNLRVFQIRHEHQGLIVGSFVNTGTKDSGATLVWEDANAVERRVRIPVAAGQKVDVGYNGGDPIQETITPLEPGQRARITVSNDEGMWKEALVPTLELEMPKA